MVIPLADPESWRPLSERKVDDLASSLDESSIARALEQWCGHNGATVSSSFRRAGLNRARRAQLEWSMPPASGSLKEIRAVARVVLPQEYGQPLSDLTFTLDVIGSSDLEFYDESNSEPATGNWLKISWLRELLDGVLEGITSPTVVASLASLAGVVPEVVPQPRTLSLKSDGNIANLLDLSGLVRISDNDFSSGADLVADPSTNFEITEQRHQQVDYWITQISADAGLIGMEGRLEQLQRSPQNE
ncbi:hypothetical protein GCM10027456_39540 [Kineosporia babensis]